MANSVLAQIEEAEQSADTIRVQATREARDMVKASEEAVLAEARQSVKAIHEMSQRAIDAARTQIDGEIEALAKKRAAERDALCAKARAQVKVAGAAIFERVVDNGHR